jgi:tetratricopeptide (TPR) repeat protein
MSSRPDRATGLSAGKQILFALVTTVAFFALVEFVLVAIGVRPVVEDDDPYVGFSSYLPLFVERTAPNGSTRLVTAPNKLSWFNRQRFSPKKEPGTYRVFSVGGSTTYGRPYDDATSFSGWLRELLPECDPSHPWEVINAGGISYASYRVAKLMEELVRYEPDLFIVYTGNNEFLERRTYSAMFDTPLAIRWLSSVLGHTRTYSAFQRLLRKDASSGAPVEAESAPGAIDGALPAEVEALLDKSVGPSAYERDDEFRDQVLDHFRYSLDRIVTIAEEAGARVMFVAPASNLADCSPFKSEPRAGLTPTERERCRTLDDQGNEAWSGGRAAEALERWDAALAIDDRFAAFHYRRGLALASLGRFEEALRAFTRARDEDVCPLRALSETIEIVREVAAERHVPLVDYVEIVEEHSDHGIAGSQFFLDHVHPTVEGNGLLGVALVEELLRQHVATASADWPDAAVRAASERIEARLDPERRANALRNLAKVLGWAGKYEEADQLALRVVGLLPEDSEAQGMAGYVHQRRGDLDAALRYYEEAVRLNPDYVRAHYLLASCARQAGDRSRAERHLLEAVRIDPRLADAWADLGVLHLESGNRERAREEFQRAISLDPANATARDALARI